MLKKITFLNFVLLLMVTAQGLAQTVVPGADGEEVTITDTSRIITIGGSITATTFALGAGDNVVAIDVSSTYPPKVHRLPKVPYVRRLSAEGILSLGPTLVLAAEEASPKSAIKQLRMAGVEVLLIPTKDGLDGTKTKIKRIAEALNKQKQAEQLIDKLNKKIQQAQELKKKAQSSPKVMYILSAAQGSPIVAGQNNPAAKMIKLAGGQNVFNNFNGFKAVNAEAIAAANPDIILMMSNRIKGENAMSKIKQMPGISLTKAAQNDRIYALDGNFLMGFGPRTGDALLKLIHIFYPELP